MRRCSWAGGARRSAGRVLVVVLVASIWSHGASDAGEVPSPEAHLGFRPGADFKLAAWPAVVGYFRAVDRASDRVSLRELGTSTEGRPMVAAVVASAATIADLERYRGLQAKLADPRKFADAAEADRASAESKAVVVITCSIHSTETASTLMAMELLHELATRDDPATLEVLDRTILLLVPSVNPDGVDKVAAWYERTKGRPWEGSGMVELYHTYAGHDTNRDWFMVNLKETAHVSRLLYREWFPTLLYDVHQMGGKGARLFVPPFHDPINPNLDPRIHQSIFMIGAHMAGDLASHGKRGVLTGALYDNWWNGGNRTTPQRHNIVGVLTEAASVKMATPVFLDRDQLVGGGRGFPDHKPSVNFVDPWPGGWWRLRDIVDYELICARSLLTLAARYRDRFQANLLAMARDSVARGVSEPPFAWVVPLDQRDPGSAARLLRALHDTGIEVRRATATFRAAGATFPAGSWVLPAAQPYRAHLKDMMERQVYPTRLIAGGRAEPPYDVAGWTLPLMMGVRTVEVGGPFAFESVVLDQIERPAGRIDGPAAAPWFTVMNQRNDDLVVARELMAAGIAVEIRGTAPRDGSGGPPAHAVRFPANATSRKVLGDLLPSVSSHVVALEQADPEKGAFQTLRPLTLAVYQPWVPSMDEGWTRFVLDSFRLPYKTVHNADLRSGRLKQRFDVLLIPAVPARTLREGHAPNETDPSFVGGLGGEGAEALRAFVAEGGRVVCLDSACEYAIETFNLPVKNVLKGLATSVFYGPGSVLRVKRAGLGGLTTIGMPEEFAVYFDQSLAFELEGRGPGQVVARYSETNPLLSGWLLGPEKLQGKGAVVEFLDQPGGGGVVLIGFRAQHRGQTHGTFRLLFNALMLGY